MTPDQRFAACFPITEAWEGWHQYSNDPIDPGGMTWCGLTQRAYTAYRAQKGLPYQWVKTASDDEIKDCFRINYWNAVRGDELPAGLDLVMYDIAINSGPITAIKFLQQALDVSVDGQFGLDTMGALKAKDAAWLINKICDHRESFWKSLTTFWRFGPGWMNRGKSIRAKALAMVGN